MKSLGKLLAFVAIGVVIGLIAAFVVLNSGGVARQESSLSSVTTSSRAVREGQPAPGFTLKTLDGSTEVSLEALRGKRVLINFWASWCPPCLKETPALIAAYRELNTETAGDVVFIGIGYQDNTDSLRAFAQEKGIPYVVVEDVDSKIGDAYGVLGLPMTFFIDRDGIVRKALPGEVTQPQVVAGMRALP
jgi:cytochrome c biogenesis protein CcmG, thiol:disulfide interchange protein DsbE